MDDLVMCSQRIICRNEATKRYSMKYKPLLQSVTDVILLHSKHDFTLLDKSTVSNTSIYIDSIQHSTGNESVSHMSVKSTGS